MHLFITIAYCLLLLYLTGHVSSSSTSTGRGRGCAKGIKEWGTGKKLDIQFDGNYCPIGDNVAKLTTQLGIIVQNGNIVPLTFLDWNNVPDDIIDAIWKDVNVKVYFCPQIRIPKLCYYYLNFEIVFYRTI